MGSEMCIRDRLAGPRPEGRGGESKVDANPAGGPQQTSDDFLRSLDSVLVAALNAMLPAFALGERAGVNVDWRVARFGVVAEGVAEGLVYDGGVEVLSES